MRISDWSSDVCSSDLDRLNKAYTETLESHDVEVILERATIAGPHEVTLASGRTVTAKFILIATGATHHVPSCPGHEHGITSNEAFHLDAIPKRILIAGAGYNANEFAGLLKEFGAKVTLIKRSEEIGRATL